MAKLLKYQPIDKEIMSLCGFEKFALNEETFLCETSTCVNCDAKRSILVEISETEMREFFGNYVVFYEAQNNKLGYRTWWQKINNAYHQPPESNRFWVLRTSFDRKRTEDAELELRNQEDEKSLAEIKEAKPEQPDSVGEPVLHQMPGKDAKKRKRKGQTLFQV
jgi:hypothetical protein